MAVPRVAVWVAFNAIVLALLAIDLGAIRRVPREVSPRAGAAWTAFWIAISCGFGLAIGALYGRARALEFFTGYLIEYALSVDNLFAFLLVFTSLKIAPHLRHRVLFWGILGAFAMRAALIVLGSAMVRTFEWLLYLFGAFLVFTAVRLLFTREGEQIDAERSWVLRIGSRWLPLSRDPESEQLLVRERGGLRFTRLFLVLAVVEITDLAFALDSIPAVLGVSNDSFVVYASNVCAILGLRSLFFLLAVVMDELRYLKFGLCAVLGFIGARMLASRWLQISTALSLAVIAGILAVTLVASLLAPSVEDG